MNVLIVLTSHDTLGDTGEKTGFWLEEFASPYYVLADAGADITLASPKGGQPPIDPRSKREDAQTEATKRYHSDEETQKALAKTIKLSNVGANGFDVLFFPGGHGPLWDLAESADCKKLIEAFWNSDRPIGAVCHGPAVFQHTTDADGSLLVNGRHVTGFSNSEEDGVGLTEAVPFLVEDMLKRNGGLYEKGEDWGSYTVTDGKLVTGQNPASSSDTAKRLLQLLS